MLYTYEFYYFGYTDFNELYYKFNIIQYFNTDFYHGNITIF